LEVSFDDPYGAYLAEVAIRQSLDPNIASAVALVPSTTGPALELDSRAVAIPRLMAIVSRHGGRWSLTATRSVKPRPERASLG
jgi:hypothetical protein